MVFSSGVFIFLFLPIILILYKLGGKNITYKNIILLIASFLFYAWGEPIFVAILIISVLINYLLGLLIGYSDNKKLFLIIGLFCNFGILFIFKYLGFVLSNLSYFFDLRIAEIALPIGISFYTFQIVSYLVDVYRGTVDSQKNVLDLALYIMMLPQLVAGPIVRYSTIAKEIKNREDTFYDFSRGISRFVLGLSKKVLIADVLGQIADRIFESISVQDINPIVAWIGAIAFTYEIYYDFSGYSDMAIGLGWCFGFHFQENFNYPYLSLSITEFWRRWHISLTDWFRDYVYIPLGGNRVSSTRHTINLLIVWLLTGIWHGAEWTFILWGLIYFFIQLFEKKSRLQIKINRIVRWLINMIIIIMCWVLFKANDLIHAANYFRNMFSINRLAFDSEAVVYLSNTTTILFIAIIFAFPIREWVAILCSRNNMTKLIWDIGSLICSGLLFIASLAIIISGSYSPFLYFNF